MQISNLNYQNVKTYNRDIFPSVKDNKPFNTYRKLKEQPHYFYFDENYKGVMAVIIVKNIMNDIDLYQFNYYDAREKGSDIILTKKLNIFDSFNYVYVFDDYNLAMKSFLDAKLKYLNSSKDIILEQIKSVIQERNIKTIELRQKLMDELEKKVNDMLSVYDVNILSLESKVRKIDKQIETTNEIAKSSFVSNI